MQEKFYAHFVVNIFMHVTHYYNLKLYIYTLLYYCSPQTKADSHTRQSLTKWGCCKDIKGRCKKCIFYTFYIFYNSLYTFYDLQFMHLIYFIQNNITFYCLLFQHFYIFYDLQFIHLIYFIQNNITFYSLLFQYFYIFYTFFAEKYVLLFISSQATL